MTLTARTIKTGNITAAATSALATDAGGSSATLLLAQGSQGALAIISGTWVATLQFEGKGAGGSWFAVPAVAIATTGGALASSTTANGNFLIAAVGAIELRVRCSAYTSGTAVVELSNAPVGGFTLPVINAATGANAQQVQGPGASAAALVGNPVRIGGSDGTNTQDLKTASATGAAFGTAGLLAQAPHLWDGTNSTYQPVMRSRTFESATAQASVVGLQAVAPVVFDSTNGQYSLASSGIADGLAGARTPVSGHYATNESTWDRWRNNTQGTLLASAARVITTASPDQTNYNARGVQVFCNVTGNPGGAETLTVQLQVKDSVGAGYYTVATSGAISVFGAGAASTGLEVIDLFPGAAETAALAGWTTQGLQLPRTWRVNVAHSASGSWTYSVSASLTV